MVIIRRVAVTLITFVLLNSFMNRGVASTSIDNSDNSVGTNFSDSLVARRAIIRAIPRPSITPRIDGTRGFDHSFSRHATQWFGRATRRTPENLRVWRNLIDQTIAGGKTFNDLHDGHKTVGYLARVRGGRYFLVHIFADGPRAGELATAFFPSSRRVSQILDLFK